jgi:ATP-dependent Clp protease ATP-binding subunit ClpB
MDSYKLTTRSQDALSAAVQSAATAGHPHVEPLHLLLALLAQTDGIARPLIQAAGGDPSSVSSQAQAQLGRLPAATGATVAAPACRGRRSPS